MVWQCRKSFWIEDTSQFYEDFIKIYNEESEEGHVLEVNVHYPKKIHELDNDLPFLPEKMRIEKIEKLMINLHDNTEHVVHI